MSGLARDAAMVTATLTSGLLAGLFFAYSVSVMRGLARTDDRTFVRSMQAINVAILNGWFAVAFVGAPLSTLLAAVLHVGQGTVVGWLTIALGLSVVTLVITFAASVPLNNELARATAGGLTVARRRFEARWVQRNRVRTISSTAAFGCLALALLSR
jgi:uncharacterized membrane protein